MKIKVNDVTLFYEKSGNGPSLILLHGNGETHRIFNKTIRRLSESYTVYAIDSRGHGESETVKDISYQLMTDDIACFIKKLQIDRPILVGFSDGGIVGLLLAGQYTGLLSKLIVCGANLNPSGIRSNYLFLFRLAYLITRDRKIGLMLREPDISADDLKKVKLPVLVLAGSKDLIKADHTRYIAEHLPNSTLQLLDGENHTSYAVHSEKLYRTILPFLKQ
ncbi:alpha/beta fold hydrolase [Sporolactobacillus pectinivorans]|uniref:alpha/beta fold hydrolase n=1 Tax=Sporolactobacillus pectinivorans TaxID=1591408 RepID=UPI000C25BC47|nr:alpha/beta hydrolase [Sporolactobacillus pectinivorans]